MAKVRKRMEEFQVMVVLKILALTVAIIFLSKSVYAYWGPFGFYAFIQFLMAILIWIFFLFQSSKEKRISESLGLGNFIPMVLIASPLLVNSILLVLYKMNTEVSSYIVGTEADWIGFSGSIIGGAITLLALVLTIDHEDNQRKKADKLRRDEIDDERALIFMPVIHANLHKETKGYYTVNQECHITIKNVSNNILRDFRLLSVELLDPIHNEVLKRFERSETFGFSTNIIVNESPHSIVIDDGREYSVNETINKEFREKLILKLEMSYKDITLKNMHFHEARIHFIPLQTIEEFNLVGHRCFRSSSYSNDYIRCERVKTKAT